jgi:hypothetical protein
VYFVKDSELTDWKIVCKVEIRGRRGDRYFALYNPSRLLAVGPDCDYSRLNSDEEAEVEREERDGGVHVIFPEIPQDIVVDFKLEDDDDMLGDSLEEEL